MDSQNKYPFNDQPSGSCNCNVAHHELLGGHSRMVHALVKDGEEILRSLTPEKCSLLHHALGIATEAGELLDAIKKHIIYNQPLKIGLGSGDGNLVEELGDLEFYIKGLRGVVGVHRDETLQANMDKLAKRYKNYNYSDSAAKERADKIV